MTEHNPEPAATGDPDPTDRGDDVNSGTVQQDMATSAALVNPYDVEVPTTLRQRIAYSRAMAQAGILPRDYTARPANVLVAGEMGRELGLSVVQSVLMLNVVEGRPTLGASGVRAVILRAGHRVKVTAREHNAHGVCTSVTVTGWRYDDPHNDQPTDEDSRTYTLAMAKRAKLVDQLRVDDAGEVTEVIARSRSGNPLPWELHTERMLEARATTWVGDTLFADVTMGLSVDRDPEPAAAPVMAEHVGTTAAPKAPAAPTPRAAEALARLKPTRRTDLADDYDPAEDVAEAGPSWWEHAGAQVSRRSKVQLAADRLAKWVTDHPEQDVVPVPAVAPAEPSGDMMVDAAAAAAEAPVAAELVDDGGDAEPDDAEPTDTVEAEVVPEPEAPAEVVPETPDPSDPDDPWAERAAEPDADPEPNDAAPDDAQGADVLPTEGLPDDGPVLDDGPDLSGAEATTPELLAIIDAAAEKLGKSRAGLMVRWIATHRKNPEDAEPAELQAFVDQLQPLLDAQS